MKVHTLEQRCLDWFRLHIGVPTASEFDSFVTLDLKVRDGELPKTYIARKSAEVYMGRPFVSGTENVKAMEEGEILENEARPFAEMELERDINVVGFCTTDDGMAGCSPDGLIGDDTGIEIKCPSLPVHTKYLLAGVVPPEYRIQVWFSLFVTGFPRWIFMSYRRSMPPLFITVERDEEKMNAISNAVSCFHDKLSAAVSKLRNL